MEEQKDGKKTKKVALVHDFLTAFGGAERVFETIAEMYPEAPIYTLVYDKEKMRGHFEKRDIRVSWLGKMPQFLQKRYRWFLPFLPAAVEALDLREFDLVISSSGAWSKGIVTRLNTKHVAYVHSPMRYVWDYHEAYLSELGAKGRLRIFTRMLLSYLRIWDLQAASRPDVLVANSQYTKSRIEKYYRRKAQVVYPAALALSEQVSQRAGESKKKRESFLVVSRLTPSKKVDAVIEAFNKLALPLTIVGVGREEERLKQIAKENISFVGFESDEALARAYEGARALIFPSEEDFGMVAVEALSFGTPVIAFEYGGAKEIIEEGVTGEFFHAQSPEIIAEGVRRFLVKEGQYDGTRIKASVAKFTEDSFKKALAKVIEEI